MDDLWGIITVGHSCRNVSHHRPMYTKITKITKIINSITTLWLKLNDGSLERNNKVFEFEFLIIHV